jgi:hypothetical protein
MRRRRMSLFAIAALSLTGPVLASPPASAAASPPNDARANAQVMTLPSTVVRGTTVDATLDHDEQEYVCGQTAGSVWYRLTTAETRGALATLQADGNLDAQIAVFRQRRSRINLVDCEHTDDDGRAAVRFRPAPGSIYFIRVANEPRTEPSTFTLRLQAGLPPAEPPGRALPKAGIRGTVDWAIRPDVAYHLQLRAAKPHRFNLVHGDNCLQFDLFPPGTGSFEDTSPVFSLGCGGYGVYTPPIGAGGRYVARITHSWGTRDAQPYRLLAGAAQPNDIAPGYALRNHKARKASVNGNSLDALDLYRINVTHRSAVDLKLAGRSGRDINLQLLTESGDTLACGCSGSPRESISRQLKKGRYYVAVRSGTEAISTYTLTPRIRAITTTSTRVNGRKSIELIPGRSAAVRVAVSSSATGSARVTIERSDPLEGWLPYRQVKVKVRGGDATYRWTPPTVGRWRLRTAYSGARDFAPSDSGNVHVTVTRTP